MRGYLLSGLACCAVILSACGSENESGTLSSAANDTAVAHNGANYNVAWDFKFDPASLPQDSDLKMLGGDLAKYALEKCVEEGFDTQPLTKCDLYVQAEQSGTLRGYLFLKETNQGVSFSTSTDMIDPRESGGQCYLAFNINVGGGELNERVMDARSDFDGRVLFHVWENGSGRTLVSQNEGDFESDTEGAFGVWYLEKKGGLLRIQQERWNYCYKNDDINMDDVFKRVLTLTLKA